METTPINIPYGYINKRLGKQPQEKNLPQRKEKSQRKILKKKGNELKLSSECEKIIQDLHLTGDDLRRLYEFSETTVTVALKKMAKRTSPTIGLLFHICRSMTQEEIDRFYRNEARNKQTAISKTPRKECPPRPPSPWYSKNYNQNLALFAEWNEQYGAAYAEYMKNDVERELDRFMEKMELRQIQNTINEKTRNDTEPTNGEERSTNCNVDLNSNDGFDMLTTGLRSDNNMIENNYEHNSDFQEILD